MKKIIYRVIAIICLLSILGAEIPAKAESDTETGDASVEITQALDEYVDSTPNVSTKSSAISATMDYIVNEPVCLDKLIYDSAAYPQFIGLVIPKIENTESSLNIRAEASEDSERLGKMSAGAAGKIIEKGDEWTKIESGAVTGYVKNEFMVTGDEAGEFAESRIPKVATVTTETDRKSVV